MTRARRVLLCDADGTLFPTEEPAFEASAVVANQLLADLGIPRRHTPDELRRQAAGRNFRANAMWMAEQAGVVLHPADLERRVADERSAVIDRLGQVLRPDPQVLEPLRRLARDHELAIVSSSALERLGVCVRATGLQDLFPRHRRYSAEDSLPEPLSKPDPAVYLLAAQRLKAGPADALAVEDAMPGVLSAVAAGIPVAGLLQFVPADEREERRRQMLAAGAVAVFGSWEEIEAALAAGRSEPAAVER